MTERPVDWESFYASYRKPGYVPGYEILQRLGSGSFGIVFRARKQSIGKDYAIKFLKVDDDNGRDLLQRELALVQHLAQVDHPNLVAFEDRGEVDGIPFLVMAYAGDRTLRHRLGEGRMSRDEALRCFAQIARGVAALHEYGLVHFDLKPENVFLKDDVARVGDFGLARIVSASRRSMSMGRGTPYFMAPEVARGSGDARSDVYSLGVMLYEMRTGAVPFTGATEWEVLDRHQNATPAWPSDLPADDRRILERCLQKQPADRYPTVAALLADLARIDVSMATAPPPANARPKPEPVAARRAPARSAHSTTPPPLPGAAARAASVTYPRENARDAEHRRRHGSNRVGPIGARRRRVARPVKVVAITIAVFVALMIFVTPSSITVRYPGDPSWSRPPAQSSATRIAPHVTILPSSSVSSSAFAPTAPFAPTPSLAPASGMAGPDPAAWFSLGLAGVDAGLQSLHANGLIDSTAHARSKRLCEVLQRLTR